MNLGLKKSIVFRTDLPLSSLRERIKTVISADAPRVNLSGRSSPVPYTGNFDADGFELVKRVYGQRAAFYPIIRGKIGGDGNGNRVEVQLRLKRVLVWFLAFWCTVLTIGIVKVGWQMVGRAEFSPGIIVLFGLMLFGYGIIVLGFKIECGRTKQDLEEIFQSRL